ncbi:ATP-binding protein [Glaciecola sp. 2405UD65-10]|uniref:ATP-binding protein n=1 Tax=Glaciecola sp. 2405UD65-10 TaxID=3397244 RepID=UPI003B59DC1B
MEILEAVPRPDFLIKSISEQGYSLKSAIADLIDNSITANATNIQVLVDSDKEPFKLFLVDDGDGMSRQDLIQNMQFPSSNPETLRETADLGRFGLGLKAASFSQTRQFTVVSRKKGSDKYSAIRWDVEHLVTSKSWQMLVVTDDEIAAMLKEFEALDNEFLNKSESFIPNTFVVWSGLYKFENYLKPQNRKNALAREIVNNTADHLGIVFHRYLEEKNNVNIRVNNTQIKPFNPFPETEQALRKLEFRQKDFGQDNIRLEGFILPSSSIKDSKVSGNVWTLPNKSLLDLEGVYIYRSNRLIIYGGWNGLIRKAPRRQLARLRVDIGNNADNLLHLNVAKSKVIIPHDLVNAFKEYIEELTSEAEKEFYNRGINRLDDKSGAKEATLLTKVHSNKGPLLEINESFPIYKGLLSTLGKNEKSQLRLLNRMINTTINKIRNTHESVHYYKCEEAQTGDLADIIKKLVEQGFSKSFITDEVIKQMGIDVKTLPEEILKLME